MSNQYEEQNNTQIEEPTKVYESFQKNENEMVSEISDEMGIIAERTRIVGNVTTKGHLAIAGSVEGDVEAKGNVIITGNVKGNISCNNLILDGCQLNTRITVSGHIAIKKSVTVIGEIFCKDISILGEVDGDIYANGQACLYKGSVVNGNVKAKNIGIELGATMNGNISMQQF